MSEHLDIHISGKLRRFVEMQISEGGLYENASEYILSLIRSDYECKEAEKWDRLACQLAPGMMADESSFVPFVVEEIIEEARK